MKRQTIALLRCPTGCVGDLELVDAHSKSDDVIDGEIICSECGSCYSVEQGIARMLPGGLSDIYVDSSTSDEYLKKRSEMAARDSQAEAYDRMLGLTLFGKLEIPLTLSKMNLHQNSVLLEAGCGTGRMTPIFAAKCKLHLAVDFSWESLLACSKKLKSASINNVDLVQADVCALPFQTAQFSTVVSCQVLEHIPTPESRSRMISELSRVAYHDAPVVISAYQHNILTRVFEKKEGSHTGGIYYYRFHRKELRTLLSQSLKVRGMTGAMVYHYIADCRKR